MFVDGGNGRTNVTGATVLDGLTITAGYGDSGGGFYCRGGDEGNACSPKLAGIHFAGNYASSGGGMYNEGSRDGKSNPYLNHVTFSGNVAEAGAAMHNDGTGIAPEFCYEDCVVRVGESSPTVVNAVFINNIVEDIYGGIVPNNGNSNGESVASLTNVIFSNNTGAAIYNTAGYNGIGNSIIINGTFYQNSAVVKNEYNDDDGDAGAEFINTIIWGNEQVEEGWFQNTFSYSIIQGGCPEDSACDHLFMATESPFVSSTDLHLKAGSPAINTGSNSAIEATGVDTDLDGNSRIVGGIVDLGAYEQQ